MQIRCSNCHKPFAIGKDEIHLALDSITAEGLAHYNAYCPHCRASQPDISGRTPSAAPDWQPSVAQENQQSNQD